GDDGFERSLFTQSRCEFGAQGVQVALGFRFLLALEFQQFASAGDFLRECFHSLRNRLELNRQLSTLPTESFSLRSSYFHFGLESLRFTVGGSHAFLSLRKLIAQIGDRRDEFEHCGTRLLLLLL